MPRTPAPARRRAPLALLLALVVLPLALVAAPAQADTASVVSGSLNWSTVKVYGPTPGVDRTFVGFESRDTSPGHQNMTFSPSGATTNPWKPSFSAAFSMRATCGLGLSA